MCSFTESSLDWRLLRPKDELQDLEIHYDIWSRQSSDISLSIRVADALRVKIQKEAPDLGGTNSMLRVKCHGGGGTPHLEDGLLR